MGCMTGFGVVEASGLKETTAEQVSQWNFGNFFFPFGIPKMIVVDADEHFSGMFNSTFQ